MDASTKILKAKSSIIIDSPFFATILLSTPILEDNSIPTMATNGDSILYNKEFTEKLSLDEVVFVLSHEVLHCVFDHMGRRGTRGPNRWNQAADYIINEILVNDNIGSMPAGALHNPNLTAKAKGTTEGVYKLLPESNEKKKPGEKGGSIDHVSDSGGDAAQISEKTAQRKILINQARNIAKAQGKLSTGLERLVGELTTSKVDWKEVLRNFISEKIKLETSWSKPKRRFLAEDIYLPSLNGEKLGEIAIAIDCSGSVDVNLLNEFASEVQGVRDSLHPSKIELIYFDSEVTKVETIEEGQDIDLKLSGGGGTAFSPIFDYINKKEQAPLCVLVLTDLQCDDFGDTPSYPVLWCVLGGLYDGFEGTPFGEVIEVKSDEN